MKYLYYNPHELPAKIHIISKALGIDRIYDEPWYDTIPYSIDELFKMAKCEVFDDIKIYLTEHEQGYLKTKNKSGIRREEVTGWISLKGIKNGGGYLEDKDL